MSDEATIRAKQSIRRALIQTGVLLIGTAIVTIAHKMFGWIDNETTTRALMVMFGIFLAAMGNAMPKHRDGPTPQTPQHAALQQSITRVGGWAMLIAGLVWAVLWAFAPRDFAEVWAVVVMLIAVAVTVIHGVWRFQTHRSATPKS